MLIPRTAGEEASLRLALWRKRDATKTQRRMERLTVRVRSTLETSMSAYEY